MGAEPDLKAVGTRSAKVDGPELVTGRGIFAEDVRLPGMLYGRVLHSPHAHARIRRIDVSRALKLEGVVDVITSADSLRNHDVRDAAVPGGNPAHLGPQMGNMSDPVARGYDGSHTLQPVALA